MTATKAASSQPLTSTDRIEKEVTLRAPRARVWRALTDAAEFGAWFGVKIEGPLAASKSVIGRITIPRYEHVTMEFVVQRVEPQHLFTYQWHPYAIDTAIDYSKEPMTLVEFHLTDAEGGTLLRIIESGFDKLPASRRAEAFRANDGGWNSQIKNIERHVAAS
jgi:uncharacterized protein YndB with AHSA1/START domain